MCHLHASSYAYMDMEKQIEIMVLDFTYKIIEWKLELGLKLKCSTNCLVYYRIIHIKLSEMVMCSSVCNVKMGIFNLNVTLVISWDMINCRNI